MSKKIFKVSLEAETIAHPLTTTKKTFTLKELVNQYVDNSENTVGGVTSMAGKLNIRPAFQRSYVVANDDFWISKLIHTVVNQRPIGVMYFGRVDDPKSEFDYIVIDGQQRLMSLAEFMNNDRPIVITRNGKDETRFFRDLPLTWQEIMNNYKLDIEICKGNEHEQINWFCTINQKSSILTVQEIRNTAFTHYDWLEKAKAYFSSPRSNYRHEINDKNSKYCMSKYASFNGDANGDGTRQECLERAIEWACYGTPYMETDDPVETYMINHCQDENADELISHYKKVIDWAWDTFLDIDGTAPYVSFRSVEWGRLYYEYHDKQFDTQYVSRRVRQLLDNYSEMSKPAGVYEYVLRGEREDDRVLMCIRNFDIRDIEKRYIEQGGCDPIDGKHYEMNELHAHHIIAVENGGKRDYDNLVLLSPENHRKYAHGGVLNSQQIKEIRDLWIEDKVPYLRNAQ